MQAHFCLFFFSILQPKMQMSGQWTGQSLGQQVRCRRKVRGVQAVDECNGSPDRQREDFAHYEPADGSKTDLRCHIAALNTACY